MLDWAACQRFPMLLVHLLCAPPDPAGPHDRQPVLLRTLLGWGPALPAPQAPEIMLYESAGFPPREEPPLATLALLGEAQAPQTHWWLRADPVHLRADRDQVRVFETAALDLDTKEASGLVAALQAHFADRDLAFRCPAPGRWYLQLPADPGLRTTPPAPGATLEDALPRGPGARHWRGLVNEAQMLLHEHPVNQRREARGALPANGLWLWGSGQLPPLPGRRPPAFWGGDLLARGIARHAGAASRSEPVDAGEFLGLAGPGEHVLLPSRAPGQTWDAFSALWIEPLLRALARGQLRSLRLTLPGRTWQVHRLDLWRFWRLWIRARSG